MQEFSEIANLEIIGSSSHQVDPLTKQICFVGKTQQQPYSYYYRTATFKKEAIPSKDGLFPLLKDRYVPVRWEPWLHVNLQIRPVGPLTPVFAFGKWFVFWVEQQQMGGGANNEKPSFTATIYYSSLDFNQNWIAPQILKKFNNLKNFDEHITDFVDRVYPSFFASSQTLLCPYGGGPKKDESILGANLPTLGNSLLSKDILFLIRHGLKNKLPQANETLSYIYEIPRKEIFVHTYTFAKNNFSLSVKSLSLWIKIDDLPKSGKTMTVVGGYQSPSSELYIDEKCMLCVRLGGNFEACLEKNLEINTWYHITIDFTQKETHVWLNGIKQNKPINTETLIIHFIGNSNGDSLFSGSMQEIIGYNTYLTEYEKKSLYENGKDLITQDFQAFVSPKGNFPNDTFYNTSFQTPIIGQPNWNVLEGTGIEFLAAPYTNNNSPLLECFRLNTTA
ncbi:MAG: neuraminidase-like domain-containing protein, partial [Flavobacterium sp.]|nr:neuraminidase-like domain-containing protein [Flavobacterium sp.]